MFLLSANLTFTYEFAVSESERRTQGACWIGQGSGQADEEALRRLARFQAAQDAMSPANWPPPPEALVGPKPRFELCGAWLTLLPADGWTQPVPIRFFTDRRTCLPKQPA